MKDGKIVMPKNYQASNTVPDSIKNRIDQWIETKGLNEFGDPLDSVYIGGNPLFDEATGVSMDRYEYILSNNPELAKS